MGLYVGGDIADLCAMARPRVGVVTAIDAVHASRAGDLDAIAAAKGELIAALPADGCAVLNADDARVLTLAARGPAPVISAGSASGATVRIERVELDQATAHTLVTVATEEGSVTANLPLFGLHFASGAALAIATAGTCGVPAAIAAERLSNVALPSGRATVRSVGMKGEPAAGTVYREAFARGATAGLNPERVTLESTEHKGKLVGRGVTVEDRPEGLHMALRVAKTPAGDELLELARERVLTSMSIVFAIFRCNLKDLAFYNTGQ
jgi:hypothetical protein